jgi:superfamily II DNA or RNA helicase
LNVPSGFPDISFSGKLRPSQTEVAQIARTQLSAGGRRLHIVAPPGSGKTVVGLYLWAECIRQPCLVLSPNSAIQSQWAARTDLFDFPDDRRKFVSTDPRQPSLLNSLTYQSVTLPARKNDEINLQAVDLWCAKLIEANQALDRNEAIVWIGDLQRHNPEYFKRRFSAYQKQVRDEVSISGDSVSLLHPSSKQILESLAAQNIGVLILDECHHLLGHWGRVLADALPILNNPIVIGLTATPPDRQGQDARDVERYDEFFGSIDFEVPLPAVVKDGFLAPYQDLAYFVRPTNNELKFIASADKRLHELVEQLCADKPTVEEFVSVSSDGSPTDFDNSRIDGDQPRISHDFETSDFPEPVEWTHEPPPVDDELSEAERNVEITHQENAKEKAAPPDRIVETDQQPNPNSTNLVEWIANTLSTLRLASGTARNWTNFVRRDPQFALAARQFLQSRQVEFPENVPPLTALESQADIPALEFWVPVLDRYVRHFLRRSPDEYLRRLSKEVTAGLRLLGIQITETGSRACASPVGRVLAYSTAKAKALGPILSAEMTNLGDSLRAVVIADFERSSAVTTQLKELMDAETGGAVAAFKSILSDQQTDKLDPILVTGSTILVDDEIEPEFLKKSRQWLKARGLQVELESESVAGFHEIHGSGSDWSPRVYVEMITELFQQGFTRCLVGTRGLLGEGWDANRINVLVDLTTVTTSMSINQLRGRSIRLDPSWPEKLANNWDVVCIAPEFTKGFDDYRRFIQKHRNLYGVTDDGAIEKGVGHVHPAFTEIKPEGLESSAAVFNAEMLERSQRRLKVRQSWQIGQPYHSLPVQAVEVKLGGDRPGFPPFGKSKDPWNNKTLTQAIANAVISSLLELGKIKRRKQAKASELAGGYIRVFLENANRQENAIFASAMRQILGPLDRPRYVIERIVEHRTDTLLSNILPHVVGKYFQKRRQDVVMLHSVPVELSRNKQDVKVFERFWNRYVSPGQAVFALREKGEKLIEAAKRSGHEPSTTLHDKEIFV